MGVETGVLIKDLSKEYAARDKEFGLQTYAEHRRRIMQRLSVVLTVGEVGVYMKAWPGLRLPMREGKGEGVGGGFGEEWGEGGNVEVLAY